MSCPKHRNEVGGGKVRRPSHETWKIVQKSILQSIGRRRRRRHGGGADLCWGGNREPRSTCRKWDFVGFLVPGGGSCALFSDYYFPLVEFSWL